MNVGKDLTRQQCVEQSDCLREEAVAESGGSGMDALVPSARWQEDEESLRGLGGVVHDAGGLADAAVVVIGPDNLTIC